MLNRTVRANAQKLEGSLKETLGEALWITLDLQSFCNDIYHYKLQTIGYCVKHAEIFPLPCYLYMSIWFSTPLPSSAHQRIFHC